MRTLSILLAGCLAAGLAACSGDGPTDGGDRNKPGPPASLSAASGTPQQVPAGDAAPAALVVHVVDARGRSVPGAEVAFTPAAGSGSVSAAKVTTDAAGQAQVTWTTGRSAGAQSVSARTGSLAPAVFTATVTPNATVSATVAFADSFVTARAGVLQAASERFGATPKLRTRYGLHPLREALAGMVQPARQAPGALLVTLRPAALGVEPARGGAVPRMGRRQALAASARMQRALERFVRPGRRLDVSPQIGVARLAVEPGTEAAVAAELRADPGVLRVEQDAFAYAEGGTLPNDPLLALQAWHYQMVDMPRAWRRTTGSGGVLVAVLDDGIRFDHPDVAANLTADGYDFVSSESISTSCGLVSNSMDGDGYDPDPTLPAAYKGCALSDAGGHGLHVAGTIGAVGNDGVGMAGVAWTVRIRPVRVLGREGGSTFDIAQGVLYAAGLPASDGRGGVVQAPSGARVINMSLSGPANSAVLHEAIIAATSAGALVVVAAGNQNSGVPRYPAAHPEVLAVSAVGPTYQRASYSNWGAHVGIAAPGGDFALGDFSYGIGSARWNFQTRTPTYDLIQGTSMATPHVVGAAALLLAQEPGLTVAGLRARLTAHALDLGQPGPDPVFGAGLLNVRNSLAQSTSIQGRLFGRVYDAATGAVVREAQGSGATFSIGQLPDGAYHVFAGIDDESDGIFGTSGSRWGGFTGADGALQTIQVQGAGSYPAVFTIGFGSEREPNNTAAQASRLMLGGSLHAHLPSTADADFYSVTLPAGTYVFETAGRDGACGLTTNADTKLELRTATGAPLAQNDDVNAPLYNYCSRITQTVAAGTYSLGVSGLSKGWYRVIVRPV